MLTKLLDRLRGAAGRRLPPHLQDARRGEDLAYHRLTALGCRVVARNYRPRSGRGEIDLLAWDGETLACVEVKTRKTADFGRPEEAVNRDKRRQLVRAAHDYARRANVDPARLRFDIVSIVLEPEVRLEIYKDAFSVRDALRGRSGV